MSEKIECYWCSDSYWDMDGWSLNAPKTFQCICIFNCGHEACDRPEMTDDDLKGDLTVVSKKRDECIWCDTSKEATAKDCNCKKNCDNVNCQRPKSSGGTMGWNSNGSGKSTYGPYAQGYTVVSGGYQACSKDSHPEVLFEWNGIKFSGQPKGDLEKLNGSVGQPKRLIVNAANYKFSQPSGWEPPKNVIDSCPDTFKELSDPKYIWPAKPALQWADVIDLAWNDGKAFPVEYEWWKKLLDLIVQHQYQEVVFCCVGGHGRTGTALSIILMMTHEWKKCPSIEAENWVKKNYCKKAVETKAQQEYLDYIMQSMAEPQEEQSDASA